VISGSAATSSSRGVLGDDGTVGGTPGKGFKAWPQSQ
jgi:hypothetical protein